MLLKYYNYRYLMNRLDKYGDNWENIPLCMKLDRPLSPPIALRTLMKPRVSKNRLLYSFSIQ